MKARAAVLVVLGGLAATACTPSWARQGESPNILLMTAINGGSHIDSDLRISTGSICPDLVPLRVENHFKNPLLSGTGFRGDITVERYEVRYIRSDGRSQEGVDVPFRITGNLAQEILEDSSAVIQLEVVRRQAKIEPPLSQIVGGGGPAIVTMFADVTLHARSTIQQTTNSVSARLQIDFADFADTLTACPTSGQ
jgi:hypothetical protein